MKLPVSAARASSAVNVTGGPGHASDSSPSPRPQDFASITLPSLLSIKHALSLPTLGYHSCTARRPGDVSPGYDATTVPPPRGSPHEQPLPAPSPAVDAST